MEEMAVHAVTPPPAPLAPSLLASPAGAAQSQGDSGGGDGGGGVEGVGEGDRVDLPDCAPPRARSPQTGETTDVASPKPSSPQPAAPASNTEPQVLPQPESLSPRSPRSPPPRSPTPSPLVDDQLAPLPTSFDPDAPPPPVEPLPIDEELAIKPVEDAVENMDVDVDAVGQEHEQGLGEHGELEQEPMLQDDIPEQENTVEVEQIHHEAMDADADAAHVGADMSGMFQDIQDIQAYDYTGDADAEHVPDQEADAPGSPLTPLPISPIPDLPEELADEPPALFLPAPVPAAESSAAAAARAASLNGSVASPASANGRAEESAADEKKRSGGTLPGPEGKRKKTSKRVVVDEDLGVARPAPKPQERTQPRAKTMTDQRLRDMLKGATVELQAQPCQRERYSCWGKCVQCIAKLGGDSCRFRNYRQFPLDPETSKIIGKGTFPSTEFEGTMTPLPREFNTELTEEHMARTEQTVAPMLVSLITAEMRHVLNHNTLARPVDAAQHRALCDFCAGTIFAGFWFCTKCGRDFCLLCERYMSDTTERLLESPWPLPDKERARIQRCSRGPDSELPLDPTVKIRMGTIKYNHSRESLQAVSRFSADELKTNWTALVNFVLEPSEDIDVEERLRYLGVEESETELAGLVREWFESHKGKGKQKRATRSRPPLSEAEIEMLYDASKTLPREPDPAELNSHPFMYVESERLDNDLFDQLWSRGEPLVVNNLLHKLKLEWTPDAFIRRFGPDRCYVLDCQTEKVKEMRTGQFFTLLKDPSKTAVYVPPRPPPVTTASGRTIRRPSRSKSPSKAKSATPGLEVVESGSTGEREGSKEVTKEGTPATNGHGDGNGAAEGSTDNGESKPEDKPEERRKPNTQSLKLKDWPATNDFSESYPDLYEDFCRVLPVPDYTARNGVMNLYAHFPKGATRPDIGPKMYNAFAGKETQGGQGSTRIHMDVADAVNIMLWASPMPDGTPGCAVWDLFKAEDADKIRDFLSNKFKDKKKVFNDPIHSQMFYLDAPLRKELFEQKGVKSFRVYQYPGQAVFIPAGCAHQVCNLSDCIKIALDFVSPHNVRRCQQLTQDFRRENFLKAWKDDVLQLYNVMWYAWTNVRDTRERRKVEAAKAEAERAARDAHLASLASGETYHGPGRRYHTTLVSSVRDEPGPSPPPGMERGTPTPTPENDDKADTKSTTPPADLVQKLMDAALVRELRPVHIGTDARQYRFAPPAPAPEPEPPARARTPVRVIESIEKGLLPIDFAYNVAKSQMGGADGMFLD